MGIDWIKGSQKWEVWAVAVAVGGWIVLAMAAVRLRWTRRDIPWAAAWICLGFLFFLFTKSFWMEYYGVIFDSAYWAAVVNVWGIGILGSRILRDFFVARRQGKIGYSFSHFSGKKLLQHLPLVVGISLVFLMSISPLRSLWPLWYGVMLAIFLCLPLSKQERDGMCSAMTNGVIAAFFFIQIYAYGFRPYDELRYRGAYGNPNINALFYLLVLGMVLCKLYMADRRMAARPGRSLYSLLYLALAGGLVIFVLFTLSRTALLVTAVLFAAYGMLGLVAGKGERGFRAMQHWAWVLVLAAVLFLPLYATIRYLPTILHRPVWYDGEYAVDKVHSFDPPNSEKYTSLEEFLGEAGKRLGWGKGLPVWAADSDSGQQPQEAQPETSSAIRREIFRLYLRDLNLTGHKLEDGYYWINQQYHAWHAQNVFLQIAYYYGIPAGGLFLLLVFWQGWHILCRFIRHKEMAWFLQGLVWMIFVGYGMLEAVWYPGQMILLMFCLMYGWLGENRGKV